jgi:hypothetical protein
MKYWCVVCKIYVDCDNRNHTHSIAEFNDAMGITG